ncbi:Mitochondrial K+-H+ exchange-related family protein [Clavispora lusitaniae]|uniref:Mitochondrial K+-H+ exchange-related family protein n=1 Tax=Clavispora lusitaniae TaxID=36911 RepID=UPI00202C4014|nr:Mitochondrial K+-H+ exchange-related family protein [Clavispora lusitaniae]
MFYRNLALAPGRSLLPLRSTARHFSRSGYVSQNAKPEATSSTAQDGATGEKHPSPLDHDSLYVLSVPITTHVSYIYCNHKSALLGTSQMARLPQIVKLENKLVNVVTKGWDKLTNSKSNINRTIVRWVRRLLSSVPYTENCLRSFPSKSSMIREINDEHLASLPRAVVTSDIGKGTVSLDQLKPIPVYHPRFQEPQAILDQMHRFRDSLGARHRKLAIWSAIGIPLTLPFALVPVVPNVPGFYIAYRLYCHVKALMGVNNLSYLLESDDGGDAVEDTQHLTFRACPELDTPYLVDATFKKVRAQDAEENEQILVTPATLDRLVDELGIPALRTDLHRALAQESARIEDSLAQDPVE